MLRPTTSKPYCIADQENGLQKRPANMYSKLHATSRDWFDKSARGPTNFSPLILTGIQQGHHVCAIKIAFFWRKVALCMLGTRATLFFESLIFVLLNFPFFPDYVSTFP